MLKIGMTRVIRLSAKPQGWEVAGVWESLKTQACNAWALGLRMGETLA